MAKDALGHGSDPRGAHSQGVQNVGQESNFTTLYHGTGPEGLDGISKSGFIEGPAFFNVDKGKASQYGPHTLEARVPKSDLMIDFDLPGARLLTVDEANSYAKAGGRDTEGWTIDNWLRSGQPIGVKRNVPVR